MRREVSELVNANLAYYGGEKADEKLEELIDELDRLEGKRKEKYESTWEYLRIKGRG